MHMGITPQEDVGREMEHPSYSQGLVPAKYYQRWIVSSQRF